MKEKQIEEMFNIIVNGIIDGEDNNGIPTVNTCVSISEALYNAGYRKQIEGEWELHKDGSGTCSECHFTQKNVWDYDNWQSFCGHCGARMKGGEGDGLY